MNVIHIECDNAKTPAFVLLRDCSYDALHRPNSMPSLRSYRSTNERGDCIQPSLCVSNSLSSRRQKRRPTSMPTMSEKKSHSMSRWEGECVARESSNAQWCGVLPLPSRRGSEEEPLSRPPLHSHSSPSSGTTIIPLPDYKRALSLVRQKYGSQCASSSYVVSSDIRNLSTVVDLPTLPMRRESLDDHLADVFDIFLPALEE